MQADHNQSINILYNLSQGISDQCQPVKRYLSDMKGMFLDEDARKKIEADTNPLIYEFYDSRTPIHPGDLTFGTSIVYPGTVGNEYFMTYGHFHNVLDTAEVYLCLNGSGYMMMESSNGKWEVVLFSPGKAVYCPKGYAHRSINTGSDKLVTFYACRSDAGHNYGTIKESGFRKLVVKDNGLAVLIDNPKRLSR